MRTARIERGELRFVVQSRAELWGLVRRLDKEETKSLSFREGLVVDEGDGQQDEVGW